MAPISWAVTPSISFEKSFFTAATFSPAWSLAIMDLSLSCRPLAELSFVLVVMASPLSLSPTG
jgi:hypothetical protein